MTKESRLRRAILVSGRQPEFEGLCRESLKSQRNELTKDVSLKSALRHQEDYQGLSAQFDEDSIDFLDSERKAHGKDLGIHGPAFPDVIVYPHRVEQIQWLASFAADYRIPLIPYGRGSSLEGNSVASQGGICVDMSKMARVLEYSPDDREIRVQAGISVNSLSDYLRESDLFLPMDVGCDASIGGMISTNASGSGSLFYGSIMAHVISLKVVLSDGSWIETGCRARKRSAGYNLTELICGAEGTLGIVVEATLRLQPVPKAITCAVATFERQEDAIRSVLKLLQQGHSLQRCELLDKQAIQAINKFHSTDFPELNHLFLEAHGNSRASADLTIEECKDVCRENGLEDYQQFSDEDEEEIPMIWKARATTWMSISRLEKCLELAVLNVAVPFRKLLENITYAKQELAAAGVKFAPLTGHLGDGSFTIIVPISSLNKVAVKEVKVVMDKIYSRIIEAEGTCSYSHGVGVGQGHILEQEIGHNAISLMKSVKKSFDPQNVMNPGKVFVFYEQQQQC